MGMSHDLATIAIVVSRVEALCLADMLNAEGIAVYIGGYHHGTVQVIPITLGGYRLMVPATQHGQASDLIREAGVESNWSFNRNVQRAGIRVLSISVGLHAGFATLGAIFSGLPLAVVAMFFLVGFQVPLSPQARGDYYLSRNDEG